MTWNTGKTMQNPKSATEPGLSDLDRSDFTDWASDCWQIPFETGQAPSPIHGSPERSLSRGVAQDRSGRRYLVEKFLVDDLPLKEKIAQTLAELNRQGMEQVLVPEKSVGGAYLARYKSDVFQVTRFVRGTELPRPGWLKSGARGEAMADFLVRMKDCARNIPLSRPGFSIKAYIQRLFKEMAIHHPDRRDQYLPVLGFLEQGFMGAHDDLPRQFAHGDFHPVNIIWQDEQIRSVIDWEFSGCKPDCYDAANLLGCAGIEHPEGLVMPMATRFLARLHIAGVLSARAWQWLPEFVLALRFAWLAEWLRKEDVEMLDTEFRFMQILMTHAEDLRDIWSNANR